MIDETKIMQLADGTLPLEEREEVKKAISKFKYGRTKIEIEYDNRLFSRKCFSDNEMKTIKEVCINE